MLPQLCHLLPRQALGSSQGNSNEFVLRQLQFMTHPQLYPLFRAQALGSSQGNSNEFVSKQWALRAQRMVYANSRGPGCFDFEYYVQVGLGGGKESVFCDWRTVEVSASTLTLSTTCNRDSVGGAELEGSAFGQRLEFLLLSFAASVSCSRQLLLVLHMMARPPLLTTPTPACQPPPGPQQNADLAGQAGQHQQLWEHFVLLGQFQGRRHRWAALVGFWLAVVCLPECPGVHVFAA